jgi:methionyl-tRNA formyltransferase
MKFAALGRTHWLFDSVQAAVARGHEVTLIATAPASPEYRRAEADFERLAADLRVDFLSTRTSTESDLADALGACGAEVAISVNWPILLGEAARAACRHGIVNAHAGDLPRFRGNACPNWAILVGETQVVVTLHQMADDLDAGPVLLQRACPLTDDTYIAEVYAFMTTQIPAMFVEVLDALQAGTAVARPQPSDPSLALRCYPRRPEDGYLDWTLPATALARLVRASAEPFAGAFFLRDGMRVTVWRAHAESNPVPSLGVPGQVAAIRRDRGEVAVLTGDGLLVLEELQRDGADRQPASAVIQSTRERLTFDPLREYLRLAAGVAALDARMDR